MNKIKLYKMGYVIDKLNITPRTIRYYDQLGLLPTIKRSDGQTRLFDKEDIKILKKINELKKIQSLSLSAIKDHLYPNRLNSTTSTIITDSLTYNSSLASNDITVINFDKSCLNSVTSISKKIIEKYKKEIKKQKPIFAIHQKSNMFELPNTLKDVLKENKIILIELPFEGLFSGAMVNLITHFIKKNKSIDETLIAIKQHKPLLSAFGIASDLNFHYQNTKAKTNASFIPKLDSIIPIFKQTPENPLTFINCEISIDNAITYLFNKVLEEMEIRQHYAFQITIFDSGQNNYGKEFQNTLSKYYSNTLIKHVKMNDMNKMIYGPKALLVSII